MSFWRVPGAADEQPVGFFEAVPSNLTFPFRTPLANLRISVCGNIYGSLNAMGVRQKTTPNAASFETELLTRDVNLPS